MHKPGSVKFLSRHFPAVLLLLCVYGSVAYRLAPYQPDDAYISYRYAENLASGNGLSFNPGERPVEGYSNFLWILYLSLLKSQGLQTPFWAQTSSALFGGLSILLLYILTLSQGTRQSFAILSGILLTISGPFVLYSISGMESTMFAFFLLLSVLGFLFTVRHESRIHFIWTCAALFLCALTRPEGIIAFLVITACLWWFWGRAVGIRQFLSLILPGLMMLTLFFAGYHFWRIWYFGEVLPTPFLSKGGSKVLSSLTTNFVFFFLRHNHYFAPMGYYYASLFLSGGSALLLRMKAQGKNLLGFISLFLALSFSLVYLCFVDWMPGMRYFAALIPLLLACQSTYSKNESFEASPVSRSNEITVMGLLFLITFFGLAAVNFDGERYQQTQQECVIPLAKWMRDSVPRSSVLAVADVGAMPYYSGLRTFDINPRSLLDFYIVRNGFSNEYFFHRSPDIVALVSFSFKKPRFSRQHLTLYKDIRFQESYRLMGISRDDYYLDRSYWIFLKKQIPFKEESLTRFPQGIGQ